MALFVLAQLGGLLQTAPLRPLRLCCPLGLCLVPVAARIPCSSSIAAKRVQLPSTISLLLTQLFRKGESLSNQPYGVRFYLPW